MARVPFWRDLINRVSARFPLSRELREPDTRATMFIGHWRRTKPIQQWQVTERLPPSPSLYGGRTKKCACIAISSSNDPSQSVQSPINPASPEREEDLEY